VAAEPGLVYLFCIVLLETHILDNPEPLVTVCMCLNSLHAHICALNYSFHVLCFAAVWSYSQFCLVLDTLWVWVFRIVFQIAELLPDLADKQQWF
jgi:hypothetical protein